MFDRSSIRHEDDGNRGSFYIEDDGERVAVMTYRRIGDKRLAIGHTEVRDDLSGKGVARLLLDTLVEWARAEGELVDPKCPYALAQFQEDPSIRDVLAIDLA